MRRRNTRLLLESGRFPVWREVCACSSLAARARMTGKGYEIAQGGYALYIRHKKSVSRKERACSNRPRLGELSRKECSTCREWPSDGHLESEAHRNSESLAVMPQPCVAATLQHEPFHSYSSPRPCIARYIATPPTLPEEATPLALPLTTAPTMDTLPPSALSAAVPMTRRPGAHRQLGAP